MALSINKTFQFVQFVSNKEHRGWISPEEFNLAAEIAQLTLYSEKEAVFMQTKKIGADMLPFSTMADATPAGGTVSYPSDFRHLIRAYIKASFKRLEDLTQAEIADAMDSEIVVPSPSYPALVMRDDNLYVYPTSLVNEITIEYLKTPTAPDWKYTVVSNRPVYNPTGTVDFGFDEALFLELSTRILQHMGINLKDTDLASYMQVHQQKEAN